MIPERLTLIGRRFSHHAVHSGYDQLATHLNLSLRKWRNQCSTASTVSLPYINEWYTLRSAEQEAQVANELQTLADNHIVHFIYAEHDYRMASEICGNQSIKWIATFHQPPSVLPLVGIDRNVIQGLSAVILMGQTQSQYFEQLGGKNIHVIHHGVDCRNYQPANRRRDRFRIVTVGHWLRDFVTYFAVVDAALKARLPLQFRLVTKWTFPRTTIPSNCFLAAEISDEQLLLEYATSSCFYLPIVDSTANNALLEALACGLPAVVSDIGCMREYMGDTNAGVLCGRDVEEHLSALLSISCIGSDYCERSAAARETAIRYDWSKVVRKYDNLYEGLT